MSRPIAVLAGLVFCAAGCAPARPAPPPPGPPPEPPAVGASCGEDLEGALTGADVKNLLECRDGSWRPFDDPYPSSDRWLTTGPELVLHGQGRRNPEFAGGAWTAIPQTADTACGAEIVDVLGPGKTGEPQTLTAEPGQPLMLDASDHMFSVRLTGYCLWVKG